VAVAFAQGRARAVGATPGVWRAVPHQLHRPQGGWQDFPAADQDPVYVEGKRGHSVGVAVLRLRRRHAAAGGNQGAENGRGSIRSAGRGRRPRGLRRHLCRRCARQESAKELLPNHEARSDHTRGVFTVAAISRPDLRCRKREETFGIQLAARQTVKSQQRADRE
jgi:hypothetical protein